MNLHPDELHALEQSDRERVARYLENPESLIRELSDKQKDDLLYALAESVFGYGFYRMAKDEPRCYQLAVMNCKDTWEEFAREVVGI
jgi:hypothetical protein